MKSHTVGIYYFRMTADSSKVKSTFALFYEIFHLATPTIKLDDMIRFHIHVCNNKGIHMCQLTVSKNIKFLNTYLEREVRWQKRIFL